MSENKQLPHDRVLDYFYKICSIPHVSKNEKSISEWVVSELKKFGGDIKVDEFHQIYASFPASKGYEHLPIICLQAHLDMVGNKKNNSNHDFNKDPINVYEEGGFLKAKDTTLGADNGIGVATILAIISDNSIKHGPLECMFTAQEEIGGVAMKDYLKFKYVLNLDNESYGNIDIGGAGLVTLKSTMDIKRSDRHPNSVYLNIEVHNFLSGHSGNRISEKRANAIKQIFYWLSALRKDFTFSIVNAANNLDTYYAIAGDCNVCIEIADDQVEKFTRELELMFNDMKFFFTLETNAVLSINKLNECKDSPLEINDSDKIIDLICSMPYGVSSYDWDVNAVETSANIPIISLNKNHLELIYVIRSNSRFQMKQSLLQTYALLNLVNAKHTPLMAIAPWPTDLNNKLAKYIIDTAQTKMNETFKLIVKHAGKEVARVLAVYYNAIGVSIGFNIREAHTPNESVEIASINKMYTLLQHLLVNITK